MNINNYFNYYNLNIYRPVYIKWDIFIIIFLHISLIIIFEIIFYFYFITNKEYNVFNYLIGNINTEYDKNPIINEFIHILMNNLTDINYIQKCANIDKNNRINKKNELFNYSLIIIIFLTISSITTVIFGSYYKKINLGCLLIDILFMLVIIALFEYLFFTLIVSKIKPISIYELLDKIIISL
jgi:hypothetical protein